MYSTISETKHRSLHHSSFANLFLSKQKYYSLHLELNYPFNLFSFLLSEHRATFLEDGRDRSERVEKPQNPVSQPLRQRLDEDQQAGVPTDDVANPRVATEQGVLVGVQHRVDALCTQAVEVEGFKRLRRG